VAEKPEYMPLLYRRLLEDEDFIAMECAQKWWYVRLLIHQWVHGSVPVGDAGLVRKIINPSMGSTAKMWCDFIDRWVPSKFPLVDEYRGVNQTVEEIRAFVTEAAEKRSQKASKAAQAKWAKQKAMLEAGSEQCSSTA
jgi:hypothetical protein